MRERTKYMCMYVCVMVLSCRHDKFTGKPNNTKGGKKRTAAMREPDNFLFVVVRGAPAATVDACTT